jgi:hypothetical protein
MSQVPKDPPPDDDETPATGPPSAFTSEFLHQLTEADELETGAEAESAGGWKVAPSGRLWAVLREEESLEQGDRPFAVFTERYLALYAAAVLAALGRRPPFVLGFDEEAQGFPLFSGTRAVGHFQRFEDSLVGGINLVDSLACSPRSLALLLEATSGLGLQRVGRILANRAAPRRR